MTSKSANYPDDWIRTLCDASGKDLAVGRALDFDSDDKAMSDFFARLKGQEGVPLRTMSLSALSGSQEELNRRRRLLGLWYGAMVFGDLLSYNPVADPDERLQQRMKALVREALLWFPQGAFAQVVLHCESSDDEPFLECTGAASEHASAVGKLAEAFRELTQVYVKAMGTTVSLAIHLRSSQRWRPYTKRPLDKPKSEENETQALAALKPLIHTLDNAVIHVSQPVTASHPSQESSENPDKRPFFDAVAKPAFERAAIAIKNLGMWHLAEGLDVAFSDGQVNKYTTTAHLYVVANSKAQLNVHTDYLRAMLSLLGKLCNFYVIGKLARDRQVLAKHKEMLDHLERPPRRGAIRSTSCAGLKPASRLSASPSASRTRSWNSLSRAGQPGFRRVSTSSGDLFRT